MSAGLVLSAETANAAIRSRLERECPGAELWGSASFDEALDLWVAVVALSPAGPLVRAGFGLTMLLAGPTDPVVARRRDLDDRLERAGGGGGSTR